MIHRVTLLPKHRCIVHVGQHKVEMHIRQALSQKKFAVQYLNQTSRMWDMIEGQRFREIMRARFDAAGFDFAMRPGYGKEAH